MPPKRPTTYPFAIRRSRLRPSGSVVSVEGELDLETVPELEQATSALPAGEPIVLDVSATSYMDSAGLHEIERLGRRAAEAGGQVVVVASPRVRRLLEIVPPAPNVRVVDTASEARELIEGEEGG